MKFSVRFEIHFRENFSWMARKFSLRQIQKNKSVAKFAEDHKLGNNSANDLGKVVEIQEHLWATHFGWIQGLLYAGNDVPWGRYVGDMRMAHPSSLLV